MGKGRKNLTKGRIKRVKETGSLKSDCYNFKPSGLQWYNRSNQFQDTVWIKDDPIKEEQQF